MPSVKDFLFGTKDKIKQAPTITPEQQELLQLIQQGLTSGEGPLKDIFGGFNEEQFNKGVSEPALKNFQDKILPQLLEKFNAGGQYGGSGMRKALLGAGTDLQSQLAQLMYQAQQHQKQNQIAGINTVAGARPFENIYKPGTSGAIPSAIQGFAQGAGQGAGTAAGKAIAG
jgi:hypothetical protein